jgi:phosphoenolpyruvate-protein phosphotransferase (PTS system enzyme I)
VTIRGTAASGGAAIGRVVRWPDAPAPADPHRVADVDAEIAALEDAVAAVAEDLEASASSTSNADERDILRAEAAFAADPHLRGRAEDLVREREIDAASAVLEAADAAAAALERSTVERVRGRGVDVRDVARRIARHLDPKMAGDPVSLPERAVVVARDLGPAQTASMDRSRVCAFVLEASGTTSHTAILARTYGIPAVVQVGDTSGVLTDGREVGVDGESGEIHPDPDAARRRAIEDVARRVAQRLADDRGMLGSATTRDGHRVHLAANVGSAEQARAASELGAERVGLFRTEFLFLERDRLPSEDEQLAEYRAAVEAIDGRVVLRTLDVGGDKPLPAIDQRAEPNPMLGVRGIRLGLRHEALLLEQLRAMLRASAAGPIGIMFPMVSGVHEVEHALAVLHRAREQLREQGVATGDDVSVGIMVEIPAAALTSAALAERVDFFSIGTNDLLQYLVAADRDNAEVGELLDPLHPALLRAVAMTVGGAAERGTPVAVCGEAASDPLAQLLLVGCGVNELSMVPSALGDSARNLAAHSLDELERLVAEAMTCSGPEAVRELVGNRLTERTERASRADGRSASDLGPGRIESDGDGWTVEFVLAHAEGLHARPADQVSRLVGSLDCEVRIETDAGQADAASVLEILALGADTGQTVRLRASGPDAPTALERLVALLGAHDGADPDAPER